MNNAAFKINREMQAAEQIKAHLAEVLGDDDDRDLVRDTIEGETSLHAVIEFALYQMQQDLALVEGLKAVIEKMASRKTRIQNRVDLTRATILAGLQTADLPGFETAICKVSRKNLPASLTVIEEADIPAHYFEPQPPKLAKKPLLDALKARQAALSDAARKPEDVRAAAMADVEKEHPSIPGAVLSNGGETAQLKWS